MTPADTDFEALKDMAKLMYVLNFEALATVPNDEDALVVPG